MSTTTSRGRYHVCMECGSDAVTRSDSERGTGFFCQDCRSTRRRDDVYTLHQKCTCCSLPFDTATSRSPKCDECEERCDPFTQYCPVESEAKKVDDPADCEEHEFDPMDPMDPYGGCQWVCLWCGLKVDESEVPR